MKYLIFWLCLMGIAMILEMLTSSYFTMWFAIGGLFAVIVQLLGFPFVAQVIVFLIISLSLLLGIRRLFTEYMETGKFHIRTAEEKMLNRQAVLTEEATFEAGKLFIDGKVMSARTSGEEIVLEKGCVVEIVAVEDGVLMIEEARKVKSDEGSLLGSARKKRKKQQKKNE